ncbi:hypothetical protein ACOMHN_018318 [Nucella lapillus]
MAAKQTSSNKDAKDQKLGGHILPETVRVFAESIGISLLPDEVVTFLADQTTYLLKRVVQDAQKFMHRAKRRKLSTADFDMSLQAKGIEPIYGMKAADSIPFRFASGGGRELHFCEDKEMDLSELISGSIPKVPLEVSVKAHWLSVEGVQPAIKENPPPVSKELQKKEIMDPSMKKLIDKGHKNPGGSNTLSSRLNLKRKHPDSMFRLKDLTPHELSVEQQFYYKECTETCVGPEEQRRSAALYSLSQDPGLHQMLPRFVTFISEGLKINVVQYNLAIQIYLMRMAKAIMENPTFYLEKYLHKLLPAVMTCVISRQLCLRHEIDNHWALRDFAARLVATICKTYSNNSNNMQSRVTSMYVHAMVMERRNFSTQYGGLSGLGELGSEAYVRSDLCQVRPMSGQAYVVMERRNFSTQYGGLSGLGELGSEVVKNCLLPQLKLIGEDMRVATEGTILNTFDRVSSINIPRQINRYLAKELKSCDVPDSPEECNKLFGYFGGVVYRCLIKGERLPPPSANPTTTTTTTRPTLQIHQAGRQFVFQPPGGTPSSATPLTATTSFFPTSGGQTPRTPSTTSFFPTSGGQAPRTPSSAGPPSSTPAGPQKIVLVTSQAACSVSELSGVTGGSALSSSASAAGTPTIVKFVSAAPVASASAAAAMQAGTGQKIVVIQGGNIKQETPQQQQSVLPSTPTPTSTLPSVVVSTTSQEMGVKSIFPNQTTAFSFSIKKEEKP